MLKITSSSHEANTLKKTFKNITTRKQCPNFPLNVIITLIILFEMPKTCLLCYEWYVVDGHCCQTRYCFNFYLKLADNKLIARNLCFNR